MELDKYWRKSNDSGHRGEYWLAVRMQRGQSAPNRAYISWDRDGSGVRTLFVWDNERQFEPHATGDNLRALKAIGRIEAARRLNV